MVTTARAARVTGVMSPKPTVAKTVMVKYRASTRSRSSEKAAGVWSDIRTYAAEKSSR
jgi:hypothetical protein